MKEKITKIFFSIILILIIVILSNIDVYALENSNEVDTTIWGHKVDYNEHSVYVKDEDNSLQWSVPVTDDFCWIKSDYLEYSTWYALDNTKGIYPDGSMFWVRMFFIDNVEYNDYKDSLDGKSSINESQNNNWIITIGVTKPDGTNVKFGNDNEFLKDTNLYIQLGAMWDEEYINNYLEENGKKNVEYISLDKDGIKGFFAKVGDSSSYVGTALGEGNIYIICGVIVAFVVVCVGAFIFIKKKNKKDDSKSKKISKENE